MLMLPSMSRYSNMVSKLTIRNADPLEYDNVSALILKAYREYEHQMPSDAWTRYSSSMQDVRSRTIESELIVAIEGNVIVGSATFYPTYMKRVESGWPQEWTAVRLVAVRPDKRERGVGKALIEECIARSRKQDAVAIALHTTPLMTRAQQMYEALGFQRIPKYDFEPRADFVVMAYKMELD